MKQTLLLVLVAAVSANALNVAMVSHINAVQTQWRASLDHPIARLPTREFGSLLGVNERAAWEDPNNAPRKLFSKEEINAAPETFDPRQRWSTCYSMWHIRDQSDCGSCWAFGAVSAMSDRECVFNNRDHEYSAEDMNSCSNGGSCNGGWPSSAFSYWKTTGVATERCRPYSLPSCDHGIPDSPNPCPADDMYPTPPCNKSCVDGEYWKSAVHRASEIYTVGGEENIKAELSNNGPCETAFSVYDDFRGYVGGIYHHVTGSYLGGHAVKIMGYGIENGVKYWLIANSWNEHWGEKGYFRIRRGNNECGIESSLWCGIPEKV